MFEPNDDMRLGHVSVGLGDAHIRARLALTNSAVWAVYERVSDRAAFAQVKHLKNRMNMLQFHEVLVEYNRADLSISFLLDGFMQLRIERLGTESPAMTTVYRNRQAAEMQFDETPLGEHEPTALHAEFSMEDALDWSDINMTPLSNPDIIAANGTNGISAAATSTALVRQSLNAGDYAPGTEFASDSDEKRLLNWSGGTMLYLSEFSVLGVAPDSNGDGEAATASGAVQTLA